MRMRKFNRQRLCVVKLAISHGQHLGGFPSFIPNSGKGWDGRAGMKVDEIMMMLFPRHSPVHCFFLSDCIGRLQEPNGSATVVLLLVPSNANKLLVQSLRPLPPPRFPQQSTPASNYPIPFAKFYLIPHTSPFSGMARQAEDRRRFTCRVRDPTLVLLVDRRIDYSKSH